MTDLNRPILIIDDDEDDRQFYQFILQEVAPNHPLLLFPDGQQALDYLLTANTKPFLILAEVRLHKDSGLELRRQIEANPTLRKRSIPFIFITHPIYQHLVEEAYELTIQGLFEKSGDIGTTRRQLSAIVTYWTDCIHPNRL
jgi:CheY-like chemotaxis protein